MIRISVVPGKMFSIQRCIVSTFSQVIFISFYLQSSLVNFDHKKIALPNSFPLSPSVNFSSVKKSQLAGRLFSFVCFKTNLKLISFTQKSAKFKRNSFQSVLVFSYLYFYKSSFSFSYF